MKKIFITICVGFFLVLNILQSAFAATRANFDPCSLISEKDVYALFPKLKTRETSTIGPNTTCNYLDSFGLPGLMVSVHENDSISAGSMMFGLGDGYRVKPVAGLGTDAAMAITVAKPEYGVEGGNVAELYVKTGKFSLLLAPARILVPSSGTVFDSFKTLAAEMLGNI